MRKNIKNAVDPDLARVLAATKHLTAKEASKKSNDLIGASTFTAWRNGKVRKPQHYTMTGALKAAGLGFAILPLKEIRRSK